MNFLLTKHKAFINNLVTKEKLISCVNQPQISHPAVNY